MSDYHIRNEFHIKSGAQQTKILIEEWMEEKLIENRERIHKKKVE
jgi:hypothetical protein